ncbi:probable G-protein coupled receptor 156 isoform X5 [Gallus gallus]|uniref:probable G-protein coupled receptor 156 isoform X5 n=1 Tax=Gallus gallus TaxID=9031 RepID=UPI001AE98C77|nr:probable G-protein coupled receptor 156 isoform X5 [Gallus gallus]
MPGAAGSVGGTRSSRPPGLSRDRGKPGPRRRGAEPGGRSGAAPAPPRRPPPPCRAEPCRAVPSRAEPSRAGRSRRQPRGSQLGGAPQSLGPVQTSSDRSGKSSPSFSAALLGVVWTFLTGGILLALFFLVFTIRFRKNRIVKMSSPNLNVVTLLGSGLTYTSAYLFGIQEQSLESSGKSVEMLIQLRLCLLCVGTSLVLGPILGKSWRLYKVFTQRVPDKRVIIKDLQLLVMVVVLVLADAVLLFTWVFSDPIQCFRSLSVSLRATEKGMTCSVSRMQSCASLYSDLWLVLILGFKLRQWKTFEEENQTLSHMAKYFSSPSRSYHSVYSEEQLYQLIGEKNSMKQLLTEKNAVIESLQEQVNNAKEKLMRLMSAEGGCSPAVPNPCAQSTGQHCEKCSSAGDVPREHWPLDTEKDGQQTSSVLCALPHCPVPLSSDAQDLWKHVSHERELTEEPECSPTLLFDMGGSLECSPEHAQECGMLAGKHPLEQDASAGVAGEHPPKVSYVSSEKLQEVLQELSLDSRTCSPAFPSHTGRMWGTQEGHPAIRSSLSPYLTRRRRRVLLPPTSTGLPASSRAWCTAGSRPGTRSHGEPAGLGPGKESEGAGRGLPQPSLSSPSIPAKGWPGLRGWAVSGTELEGCRNTSLQDWRQQSSLGVPARPILHSLYHYPDSDSSSSSEEVFPCCHRPCCQLCLQSPRGSLGSSSSSSTETDMEPGGAVGCWLEPQGKTQPVVNFKEDLKPTFV